MNAPVALIILALVLGYVVAPVLRAATWPLRAPGLGTLAWIVLSVSTLGSLVLAGLSLAVPELPEADGLSDFFHACSDAVQEHYSTSGGAALALAGALVAGLLMVRTTMIATTQCHSRWRSRARHRQMLTLVGRPLDGSRVIVVDHPEPLAYAIPGRRGQVVLSAASIDVLTPTQLEQVLRHEAAHLRSRHHRAIAISEVVSAATYGLLGTRSARVAIGELVEMHADDAVDNRFRTDLAEAVLILAGGARAAGALNAAHQHVAERVLRLRVASRPIAVPARAVMGLVVLATAALPLALAMSPAIEAIAQHYCPVV